jgi:hypothetical protein
MIICGNTIVKIEEVEWEGTWAVRNQIELPFVARLS